MNQVGIKLAAEGAVQVQQDLKGVGDGLDRMGDEAKKASREVRSVGEAVGQSKTAVQSLAEGLRTAFIGGGIAATIISVKNAVVGLTSTLVDAQVQLDRVRNSLGFAVGDGRVGGELEYLRQVTDKLGVSFEQLAPQYGRLAAATRGTNLEGRATREIFESIAQAAVVMGLGAEEAEGALRAVVQMVSKGQIQAEELRGQLGERLPRAFQLFAESMGKSTQELSKMLELGQVAPERLREFAQVLKGELAPSLEQATQSMTANINRLANAWLEFKQKIATGGTGEVISGQVGILADGLANFNEKVEMSRRVGGSFRDELGLMGYAVLQFLNPMNLIGYSALSLSGRLKDAEEELKKLQGMKDSGLREGAFLENDIYQTRKLIRELEAAKAAKDALAATPGPRSGDEFRTDRAGREQAATEARNLKTEGYMVQFGPAADKAQAKIAEVRAALGGMIPPELEARIRASFSPAEKGVDALKAVMAERALMAERELRALTEYDKREAAIEEQLLKTAQAERELAAARSLRNIATYEAAEADIDKALGSADDMVAAIDRETAALRMSNTEREISNALLALERTGLEKGSYAYEQYAAKIREAIVNRETVRDSVDQAKQIEAEWQRTSDQIGQSLSDALMQGGKSAAEYLKGLFRSMVLRPIIQAVVQPVVNSIGGFFGMGGDRVGSSGGMAPGAAGAGQSMGASFLTTIASGIGSLGKMFGSDAISSFAMGLSGRGSYLPPNQAGPTTQGATGAAGLGATVGSAMQTFGAYLQSFVMGRGIGQAISNGYSVGGSGNAIVNIGSLGGVIGGTIAGLINRAFGKKLKDFGFEGEFTADGFEGNRFKDFKGGFFRSDSTNRGALDPELEAVLDAGAAAANAQLSAYIDVLGLPAKRLEGFTQSLRVSLKGLSPEEAQQAIADSIQAYQEAQAQQFADVLQPFAEAGESAVETLQRLTILQTFAEDINTLGGVFGRVAQAGPRAVQQLAEFAGGLETLGQQITGFVTNYFSADEIAGLRSQEFVSALGEAGIGAEQIAGLDTREEFRALVESVDVSTEQGRQQLAALLGQAENFAGLTDYLQETGQTVTQAAMLAPDSDVLAPLFDANAIATDQLSAITGVEAGVNASNGLLQQILDQLRGNGRGGRSTPAPALDDAEVFVPGMQGA